MDDIVRKKTHMGLKWYFNTRKLNCTSKQPITVALFWVVYF
jgi:hypothetical protein